MSTDYKAGFNLTQEVGYTTQKWLEDALHNASKVHGQKNIDIVSLVPQYSYGTIVGVKCYKKLLGKYLIASEETFVSYDILDNYTQEIELDVPSNRVKELPKAKANP